MTHSAIQEHPPLPRERLDASVRYIDPGFYGDAGSLLQDGALQMSGKKY